MQHAAVRSRRFAVAYCHVRQAKATCWYNVGFVNACIKARSFTDLGPAECSHISHAVVMSWRRAGFGFVEARTCKAEKRTQNLRAR